MGGSLARSHGPPSAAGSQGSRRSADRAGTPGRRRALPRPLHLAERRPECQPSTERSAVTASTGRSATPEVIMTADDRRFEVLRAIVSDYVATREPVGSKSLVERHQLGVSPATIRNDMAVLEDEGYIAQPHTAAGRIPTDKGYRLFVDRLSQVKPLSASELGEQSDRST